MHENILISRFKLNLVQAGEKNLNNRTEHLGVQEVTELDIKRNKYVILTSNG